MEEYDLNIDNYTVSDLLSIINQDVPTVESITQFIDNKKEEYSNNPELIQFFDEMKEKFNEILLNNKPVYLNLSR